MAVKRRCCINRRRLYALVIDPENTFYQISRAGLFPAILNCGIRFKATQKQ
jgi:hypothetical protein